MVAVVRANDALLLAWMRRSVSDGTARAIREAAQLTQSEMAGPVQVTSDAIGLWERGLRVPTGDAALRYARLLDRLRSEVAAPS